MKNTLGLVPIILKILSCIYRDRDSTTGWGFTKVGTLLEISLQISLHVLISLLETTRLGQFNLSFSEIQDVISGT